jgi:Family of unknown function (DUF5686)/CarboxypepD_reg-like domain
MKRIYYSSLLLLFPAFCFGQFVIKGKVVDGSTNEPLAFVSIIFNNDPHSGTTTDIDGKFYFNSSKEIKLVTCTYISYKGLTLTVNESSNLDNLVIRLYSSVSELKEVIVKSGENPANRIIRKVIQNKDINNPEKVSSFKYTSYNKIIYDFKPNDTLKADSIRKQLDKVLKGGHLMIMESVTERKFIAPDKNQETIIGTKVSGLKNPPFAPLATDIQPFSFYKDIFPVLGVNYLNPISNGSLNKYQFFLEDTLFQSEDTVYIISFKPKPGKNIDALTGVLYINTNKYAIQNVIAEPFEKGLVGIRLQQKYQLVDNKQWFPEQLNFELILNQYNVKGTGIRANGKGYIKDVELYADINKKDFTAESLRMEDSAGKRNNEFWTENRTEALQQKEQTTYRVIDSIGEKINLDNKLKFFEKLLRGRIPFKVFDIDLTRTLVFNRFEGYRAGLGVYTNEKLSKLFSVGGFFGYGLKDHRWKYGGEIILIPDPEHELEIRGKFQNVLREAGASGLKYFGNYNFLREYMASRMDVIKQYSFAVGFRTLRYANLNFSFDHTQVHPLYEYEYQPANQQKITNYTYSDFTVNLRYAYREKIFRSGNQRMSMGTKYPVLYLVYSRGIKGFYNSQFNFNKVEARIEKSFLLRNVGQTMIRVDAGYIDRDIPYGLLFTGEGAHDKSAWVQVKNYFQTAKPYEFLSDRYINLFFSHNFSSLLFKTKKFQPQIILHQNIGWGTLAHPENHQLIGFRTKEKGFFESGLQIDDILKFNYLNFVYVGFGAALYYRYGHYSRPDISDNLALKLTMNFSIK